MAEIKYQHAYDEDGKLVSIDDYTKETSKFHVFRCVGCGKELLPRAIGSKCRKAHFYHKELVECSGETYIHKLGKLLIKKKFDESEQFLISYRVSKECSVKGCRLRNVNCHKDYVDLTVDLKRYYDTCAEEQEIDGFIADLLLTNSKKADIPPVLIEICVTHPCDDEKRKSGLKIIEVTIKKEQEVNEIFTNGVLVEPMFGPLRKKNIEFISFKRTLEEKMVSPISRYVFNPSQNVNGYITEIDCQTADYKTLKDSEVELNIVRVQPCRDYRIWLPLQWMSKYKHLRRCNLCKFYFATQYENTAICRLSRKYGKPAYPKMDDAVNCRSYNTREETFFMNELDRYHIEEIIAIPYNVKEQYRVVIAGSSSFCDSKLFEEKCNHFLSAKMESHKVVFLSGTSKQITKIMKSYASSHGINVEEHPADWDRYGNEAGYLSNDEMLKHADALIAFWDGKGRKTGALIQSAKTKGIKVAVVKY